MPSRTKRKTPAPTSHAAGHTYTAIIQHSAPWWIGWIEEVPGVNCQERTRDGLLESLRVTLREALEMNRQVYH